MNIDRCQIVHKIPYGKFVGYKDFEILINIYVHYPGVDERQISQLTIVCRFNVYHWALFVRYPVNLYTFATVIKQHNDHNDQ